MYATTVTVFGLAMAGVSFAQSTVTTLYVPGADQQPLVASVITSDATATTYLLQCVPGTDSSDCGFPAPVTLTEGPATAAYTIPAILDNNGSVALTGYLDCSLAGTTSAVCVESAGGDEANFPGISTVTYVGTDQAYISVTITGTAGSASSSSPNAAVPSTTSATPVASNTSGTATTSGSSANTSESGGSSSAAGKSTSSSTAGMPAITGHKCLLLGGAAVALAMIG